MTKVNPPSHVLVLRCRDEGRVQISCLCQPNWAMSGRESLTGAPKYINPDEIGRIYHDHVLLAEAAKAAGPGPDATRGPGTGAKMGRNPGDRYSDRTRIREPRRTGGDSGRGARRG